MQQCLSYHANDSKGQQVRLSSASKIHKLALTLSKAASTGGGETIAVNCTVHPLSGVPGVPG